MTQRLIVEADGGSRGNPGPAAYGALVRDADTDAVLVEVAEYLGETTNNVAEYHGVLAGVRAAIEINPQARIEARLDSKLVVEQMSGRWAIKNAVLQDIAKSLRNVSAEVEYTWVPRAQNTHADRLANEALDAAAKGNTALILRRFDHASAQFHQLAKEAEDVVGQVGVDRPRAIIGWAEDLGAPTVTLLGRHGATEYSVDKRFSGRGGKDVGLAPAGVRQAQALARTIAARGPLDMIVSSPLLRARQTAAEVAAATGASVQIHDDVAECSFGDWDGHTLAQVQQRWPDELAAWLASMHVAPPGGESFAECADRVEAAREQIVQQYAGQTVAIITHVSPIKLLVRSCLDAPLDSVFRMELAPGSLSTIAWFPDGNSSLFGFADGAHLPSQD